MTQRGLHVESDDYRKAKEFEERCLTEACKLYTPETVRQEIERVERFIAQCDCRPQRESWEVALSGLKRIKEMIGGCDDSAAL